MAMLCRDLCRDLLPAAEYFDYGLWIPAGKYRPDSDVEDIDSEPEGGQDHKHKTPPAIPTVVVPPGKTEKLMQECGGSKSGCTPEQAANVARKLGAAPSMAEIELLKTKYGTNITKENLEAWISECAHNDSVESLTKFFEYYDKAHSGKLTKLQLSNLLRTYGEPLSDQELSAIIADMGLTGDSIDYKVFVEKLLKD